MKLNGLRTLACGLLLAVRVCPAGIVSATPGTFQGVITLNAPVIADVVQIDARDVTNTYTATAKAVQNGPACTAGSKNWCYSLVVESALATQYYLRPIAFRSANPPFISSRMPFLPQGPFPIPTGGVQVENLTYQPGEISGNVTAKDMQNAPLPLRSVYFSMLDNSNAFPESCGGSLEFCPFNSVFQAVPTAPQPGPAHYELFLHPGDDYTFLTQGFVLDESTPGQPQAQSTEVFNLSQHYGSVNAGQSVVIDHPVVQKASVSGSASLSLPVYNMTVSIQGTTVNGLPFVDSYTTNSGTNQPLPSTNYLLRVFDYADFTKPMSVQTLFTLSANGQTALQYPAQPVTLNPGDTATVNFTGTSATITGRVTFDPPYPAGNIYPGIQAEATQGFASAQTTLNTDAQGGTFLLPVFGGNWNFWRFGWNFNLGNPNFTSNYFVGQFLPIPVAVGNGQTVQQNFTIDTALLKTFFTAPAGTTLTNPQLSASSGTMVNGVFVEDAAESAQSEGLNQNFVPTAEARQVLRVRSNGAFKVRPSAVINPAPNTPGTGRTDFSPFIVQPHKGDVIVMGVPGSLSLTVTSPKEGQVLPSCTVQVTGSATGTTGIVITVNGLEVPTTPANNPNDANQVLFSTTIGGSGAATTITVVASAPTQNPITDVIHVSAGTAAPNVTASIATTLLWPPNHDLVPVGLAAGVSSACDAHPTLGVAVYSNEADSASGSGNMSPDAKDLAPGTLRLRSERQGGGNGRVYLIVATGGDHIGDSAKACATVVVPQDQSSASIAAVNAMAASAAATCNASGQAPAGYVPVGVGPVIGPKQ